MATVEELTKENEVLRKKWDAIMKAPGNRPRGANAETLRALRKAERNYERMVREFDGLKHDWIEDSDRHRKQVKAARHKLLILLRGCSINNPTLIERLEEILAILEDE